MALYGKERRMRQIMSVYTLLIMQILHTATFFVILRPIKCNQSNFYCLQNMSKYEMY
mgnify:CR=1 FL=1|jgi:hypothetical protein